MPIVRFEESHPEASGVEWKALRFRRALYACVTHLIDAEVKLSLEAEEVGEGVFDHKFNALAFHFAGDLCSLTNLGWEIQHFLSEQDSSLSQDTLAILAKAPHGSSGAFFDVAFVEGVAMFAPCPKPDWTNPENDHLPRDARFIRRIG